MVIKARVPGVSQDHRALYLSVSIKGHQPKTDQSGAVMFSASYLLERYAGKIGW